MLFQRLLFFQEKLLLQLRLLVLHLLFQFLLRLTVAFVKSFLALITFSIAAFLLAQEERDKTLQVIVDEIFQSLYRFLCQETVTVFLYPTGHEYTGFELRRLEENDATPAHCGLRNIIQFCRLEHDFRRLQMRDYLPVAQTQTPTVV